MNAELYNIIIHDISEVRLLDEIEDMLRDNVSLSKFYYRIVSIRNKHYVYLDSEEVITLKLKYSSDRLKLIVSSMV
jgi:hypothetical protein